MVRRVFGAVDIGASSGRVIAGVVEEHGTMLHTVHRFPNGASPRDGHLRWNITGLFSEVMHGLHLLAETFPEVESIGIDTWAIDYALLDAEGHLLAEPVSYRDGRTNASVIERVHDRLDPAQLYALNGLQFLPFTTIYQLEAEKHSSLWARTQHVVLLPDLLAFWLTGVLASEATNASTTGLVDVRTGTWSPALLRSLDLPHHMFPPMEQPGAVRGRVLRSVCEETGLNERVVVTTVGSHDTASAVVAIPATTANFAYVSSGTWSLVGVELAEPVLTDDSRSANFTNEEGVDGRTRFLRNTGGLWLLQESMRAWEKEGHNFDLSSLLTEAEMVPPGGPVIDVGAPTFIAPGNMPARIAAAAEGAGEDEPSSPAEIVRCILDSLALAYALTVEEASRLSGVEIDTIHIVGGGSQNHLLCQLTADATGIPVTSGPVEATALGNVMVQARAHGAAPDTLEAIRLRLAATADVNVILPSVRTPHRR